MSNLDNLANYNNEQRQQNIIKLQQGFAQQRFVTVASVMQAWGVTRPTVLKWAKDGNVPLIDTDRKVPQTVVPVTAENEPRWWPK